MNKNDMCCSKCVFFKEINEGQNLGLSQNGCYWSARVPAEKDMVVVPGLCRRYPPRVLYEENGGSYDWPIVSCEDFCGEFLGEDGKVFR